MNKEPRRSDCSIHCALTVLGDRWTLVIVRDLLLTGGATFGQLLESPERIATNTLSSRLASLEAASIVTQLSADKRYLLTEKGLDLAPVLLELALWSVRHEKDVKPPPVDLDEYQKHPQQFIEQVKITSLERRRKG